MTTVKVSISLPEDLLKRVDALCRQLKISRSELIARVLEEKLGAGEKGSRYPTVLWKLSTTGYLRLRSPRLRGRSIRERWVVEEVGEE
ncbi:MAG: ribbon-helix-helix protein, CopG family [Thermofilum sp.]